MASSLYLETSAVLATVLEQGPPAELSKRMRTAERLITSRLSLVESARALHRLRLEGALPETALADAARALDAVWARCHVWELTPSICESAAAVAPRHRLRTLDALHLATYLEARRRVGEVDLVTADRRLEEAAGG